MRPPARPPIARDLHRAYEVDPETGCWVWARALAHGYGRLCVNRQYILAHRLMYEQEVGPIPEGMTIDHLCQNKACVNPSHLEVVTLAENVRRAWRTRMAR